MKLNSASFVRIGPMVGARFLAVLVAPVFAQSAPKPSTATANPAAAGMDPSGPAFRMPFQLLTSANHIAQWTQQVVIGKPQPH